MKRHALCKSLSKRRKRRLCLLVLLVICEANAFLRVGPEVAIVLLEGRDELFNKVCERAEADNVFQRLKDQASSATP